MADNGTPFVAITRSMLSRFQRTLEELRIRHIRTQIDTPWTNGKDVHLCQAASSARSGMNIVPDLSIANRTRSFVRARALIA